MNLMIQQLLHLQKATSLGSKKKFGWLKQVQRKVIFNIWGNLRGHRRCDLEGYW